MADPPFGSAAPFNERSIRYDRSNVIAFTTRRFIT